MTRHWDAIIVGGGHNGLVCAAYLARAGRKVLVLERRHVLGGAAVSEQIFPGFTFSVFSYVVSLLRPEIIRELELPRHGLQILPLESTITPMENGDYLAGWADPDESRRELCRHSTRDADAMVLFGRLMHHMAMAVKPIIGMVPPDPASLKLKDPADWKWPYDIPSWVFTHRDLTVVPNARIELTSDDVSVVHERMVEAAQARPLAGVKLNFPFHGTGSLSRVTSMERMK